MTVMPEQEPDDFTLIDGIGPALQKRLRGFGVRYFSDLAALDADGIERLAAQLELDDEIVQSDWVGQAARLASLHGSSL